MCIKNFDLQLAAWQRKKEKLWLFLHVSSTPPRCKHVKNSCGRRRNPATSSHSVKGKRNISTAGFTFYYPFKKNKKEKATKEGARQTQQEPWLLSGSDSFSVTIFITTTAPSSLRTSSHSLTRLFSPLDMKICQTAQSAFYAMYVGSAARKHSEYSRDGSSQAAWPFLC